MTLVEVLVVIAVLFIFAAMVIGTLPNSNSKREAQGIQCVCNLKQVGLAFRVWAEDHEENYPMQLSQTNGGTMEYTTGANVFRHFQIISNELSTPRVLFCPAESDRWRIEANAFGRGGKPDQVFFESNTNLSYFVGVDVNPTNVTMILSGDHNITNGLPLGNGILTVTSNRLSGWTDKRHGGCGNLAMADGSVQQASVSTLRQTIAGTGFATNRLQMP